MQNVADPLAFPTLTSDEIEAIRPFADPLEFNDGEFIFRAGQPEIDLFIVESGSIDILNAATGNTLVATHHPGAFSGDIDLLTRRPPIVSGVAGGHTHVLRLAASKLREVLNRVPGFGEKLMNAFTRRRKLLTEAGAAGLQILGYAHCKDTSLVREFLYKNFVPFNWYDPSTPEGQRFSVSLGSPKRFPTIVTNDGTTLTNPTLHELARTAGIWQTCPDQDVDLAIVGAGPSGIAAAVYAASEGLSTVVLDRLGPGGQASGSSRIENFIGFPAGLSGMELATRGVLQMLKFGARMVAPVSVQRLEPSTSPKEPHILHLDCGAKIRSYTILAATGVRWKKLEATNAERFEGAGLYYVCTSVEALLYDKSDVAVVGAGNSAGQAVMFLAECCRDRQVHMLIRHELGSGMSSYLVERIRNAPNVKVHESTEIAALHGKSRLDTVELKTKSGDHKHKFPCAAVFVFIGADPAAPWLPPSVCRDKLGYVMTGADVQRANQWPLKDRDPCPLETSLPGILAAGDIRAGSTKRVGFAVGDGSLAVTCTHKLRTYRS